MSPEELREKVARVVRYAIEDNHCPGEAALAVVREAMREPSEEMMKAGVAANDRYALEVAPCSGFRANDSWRAMLAASPLWEPVHLTTDEQEVFAAALRRSAKIVREPGA